MVIEENNMGILRTNDGHSIWPGFRGFRSPPPPPPRPRNIPLPPPLNIDITDYTETFVDTVVNDSVNIPHFPIR